MLSLGLMAWLTHALLRGEDKTVFMPGALTDGHHQIGLACSACHTDPLGGGAVLQQACIDCHGDIRKKPFDSHPRAKFEDPRNADLLANIDALQCITCHREHQPAMTLDNGVTQPRDFCVYCHADIAEDRPSHRNMAFATCATGGCHNFHNNRALYTDFLIKHLHEPAQLETQQVAAREYAQILGELADYPAGRYPVQPLTADQADAPPAFKTTATVLHDWSSTSHARSGVNCSACHDLKTTDATESSWTEKPDQQACAQCHQLEITRFQKGKHGMRLAVGLPPMTPAEARLPMKTEAAHKTLTCNRCHPAHRYDTRAAAVEACLGCHDDQHSLAYKQSPHFKRWQQELSGELPAGNGVSCATCHMPRISFDVDEWTSRIMVDHDQNANLSPNSKMLRSACLHCHGLGFSIDALADSGLIERNFRGQPSVHIDTMDLAERDHQRALQEGKDGSQ